MNTTTTPFTPTGERQCGNCGTPDDPEFPITYWATHYGEKGMEYFDLCPGCLFDARCLWEMFSLE